MTSHSCTGFAFPSVPCEHPRHTERWHFRPGKIAEMEGPPSYDGFSQGRKMVQKSRMVQAPTKIRRERIRWCHRLAVGADDPKFSAKLEALAEEYEERAGKIFSEEKELRTV